MREIRKAYYSVHGIQPWTKNGDTAVKVHKITAKYLRPEVADVCLNCPEKKCINSMGCEKYQKAVEEVVGGRVGNVGGPGPRARQITIDGETRTISGWAAVLGCKYCTIVNYARDHSTTVEFEIARRLKKERAENGNGNDTP